MPRAVRLYMRKIFRNFFNIYIFLHVLHTNILMPTAVIYESTISRAWRAKKLYTSLSELEVYFFNTPGSQLYKDNRETNLGIIFSATSTFV